MTRSAQATLCQVSTGEKMEEASITDHSAVRVMLGVRDLEWLLRDAYENHQKSETRTGAKDTNWERSYAQYIIGRLAVEDSSGELFDAGSTSNLITESSDILPRHD